MKFHVCISTWHSGKQGLNRLRMRCKILGKASFPKFPLALASSFLLCMCCVSDVCVSASASGFQVPFVFMYVLKSYRCVWLARSGANILRNVVGDETCPLPNVWTSGLGRF